MDFKHEKRVEFTVTPSNMGKFTNIYYNQATVMCLALISNE
jgi:hypothetical protein